jgi:hypothetical protein
MSRTVTGKVTLVKVNIHDERYPLTGKNTPPILQAVRNNTLSIHSLGMFLSTGTMSECHAVLMSMPKRTMEEEQKNKEDTRR